MNQPLKTEAWAYLNIRHPLCAWATYRGVLVAAPGDRGFLSVWAASMLADKDDKRVLRELSLEATRNAHFPHFTSRMTGMYCFTDLRRAELALQWGTPNNHFRLQNLAELSLAEAKLSGSRHDANWITHQGKAGWQARYWSGEPHPDQEPIWETLVTGRLIILGSEIRNAAMRILTRRFPDSVVLLETARVAAWVGSDLGNVAAFLFDRGKYVRLMYLIDMRSANDFELAMKLREVTAVQGVPIDQTVFQNALKIGAFKTPDFRKFEIVRPKNELSMLERGDVHDLDGGMKTHS